MKASERVVLVGIVAVVGLLLRIGFVATAEVESPLRADAGQYAQYAHNLVQHGTYSLSTAVPPPPDSFRSPGYPLFLAGCRWLAGEQGWYALARWLQAVLGALLVPLTFRLARPLLPFPAALAAAAYVAVCPHLVVATGYVLTEALSGVALTLAFVLLGAAARGDRRSARAFAAAGLAFGLAALVNEAAAPLPLLLAFAGRRAFGRRALLAFVLAALAPVLAWTVRNETQPLAHTGAERALATLSHGSYPGLFFATDRCRGYPYREDPEQPAFGASWARFRDVMGRRVAERPWRYLSWYLVEKPVWVWGWDLAQGAGGPYVYPVRHSILDEQPVLAGVQALLRFLHLPFCLLAAGGLLLALRRRRDGRALAPLLALAVLYSTAVPALFLPDPRYLGPLRPVQAVLAALAASWLWSLRRRRSAEPQPAPPESAAAASAPVQAGAAAEPAGAAAGP